MGEAGQARLGSASLDNVLGLWGTEAALHCLVHGPGVTEASR